MPKYRIAFTITRVSEYETEVECADLESAEAFSMGLVPDEMDEIDDQTIDWSTEITETTD